MSQEAFIETIADIANLDKPHVNQPRTPHRIGYPVDSIPISPSKDTNQHTKNVHTMQQLIGCLNWLSVSTRPDIATITNLLAKYTANPSKGHIEAARRVIKYLKGTKTHGILFSQTNNSNISSFLKFPLPQTKITSLSDANWGPQDQSKPLPHETRKIHPFNHAVLHVLRN